MITQKPISLKIDTEVLEKLDKEVSLGWRKRNWHINEAIRMYLKVQDLNRVLGVYDDIKSREEVLNNFLRRHVPNGAKW